MNDHIKKMLAILDARGYELKAFAGDTVLIKREHEYHAYVTWKWSGEEFLHGNYFGDAEEAEDDFYKRMGPCISSR